MSSSSLPITKGSTDGARWHDIEYQRSSSDRCEAMNLRGGRVLVRTTLRDTEPATDEGTYSISTASSMIVMEAATVAKRWQAQVTEPEFDDDGDHIPASILVNIEYSIVPHTGVRRGMGELLRFVPTETGHPSRLEFCWFDADYPMPRPTDEQVRAYIDGLPPPREVDSLRRELDTMRERYREAEQRVTEARAAREDEGEPWIWSDDDSAKQVGQLGNAMIVKITGGHLRGLLERATVETHSMLEMAFKLMAMAGDKHVPVDKFAAVARPLCEAISASTDPRIACGPDGRRRSPVDVAVALFGGGLSRTVWEHKP
jgi:hypothetical protein